MRNTSIYWTSAKTGEIVVIAQRLVAVTFLLITAFGSNVNAETSLAVGERVYVCYEIDQLVRIVSKTSRRWDGCEGIVKRVDGSSVEVMRIDPICAGYEASDGELNIVPASAVEVDKVACWRR